MYVHRQIKVRGGVKNKYISTVKQVLKINVAYCFGLKVNLYVRSIEKGLLRCVRANLL